jgi:hypothetical protein
MKTLQSVCNHKVGQLGNADRGMMARPTPRLTLRRDLGGERQPIPLSVSTQRGLSARGNTGLREAGMATTSSFWTRRSIEPRKLETSVASICEEHPDIDIVYGRMPFFTLPRP